jgi:hypothetical protein
MAAPCRISVGRRARSPQHCERGAVTPFRERWWEDPRTDARGTTLWHCAGHCRDLDPGLPIGSPVRGTRVVAPEEAVA